MVNGMAEEAVLRAVNLGDDADTTGVEVRSGTNGHAGECPGGDYRRIDDMMNCRIKTIVRRRKRMELVEVTVYYLEMLTPSHRSVPAPRDGLTVLHVQAPTVPFYRSLYDAVGKEFHWLSRRKMSDEALAAILSDPRNELHVLHVDGTPAGFAELDRRQPDEIELVQFGLD